MNGLITFISYYTSEYEPNNYGEEMIVSNFINDLKFLNSEKCGQDYYTVQERHIES